MRETGKVGIARVVIRSKEALVALRPMGDALGMATMIFADEVLSPDRLDEIKEAEEVKTTKRELDIAKQLVESLAADFKPEQFSDAYREQVLEMIERKAQGKEIAVQPEPEEDAAPAPDLMGALKASLEAVQGARGVRRRGRETEDAKRPPKLRRRKRQRRKRRNPQAPKARRAAGRKRAPSAEHRAAESLP